MRNIILEPYKPGRTLDWFVLKGLGYELYDHTCIQGTIGSGKTHIALTMITKEALNGKTIFIVSFELNIGDIQDRIKNIAEQIGSKFTTINKIHIYKLSQPDEPFENILQAIQEVEEPIDILFIDSIDYLSIYDCKNRIIDKPASIHNKKDTLIKFCDTNKIRLVYTQNIIRSSGEHIV